MMASLLLVLGATLSSCIQGCASSSSAFVAIPASGNAPLHLLDVATGLSQNGEKPLVLRIRRSAPLYSGEPPPPPAADQHDRPLSVEQERELFNRNIAFFGEAGFARIQEASVTVVGLGGVGSHAVHMLARSGVRNLRIVDFDQVTLSSLNRHAVATFADVGLPKATVMRDRLKAIVPNCHIEAVEAVFSDENAKEILGDNPTYVFDCIDNVNTKADLIGYCKSNGLQVITSLGAGLKADPTRMCISQLSNAKKDPLATRLRHFLRKKGHGVEGVTTVFCHELQRGKLIRPSEDDRLNKPQEGVPSYLRLGVMPVLGTMPAIFGDAMAAYVLCEIAEQPIFPAAMEGLGRHIKHRFLYHLRNRERKVHGDEASREAAEKLVANDMEEVIHEVWAGRCVATGKRIGEGSSFALTRWDRNQPPTVSNLILLASAELADQFDQQGQSMLEERRRRLVEERLAQLFSDEDGDQP